MRHDRGPDLDERLPQRRHRPVLDALVQGQPRQEVAQVVRQGEHLKPDLIVHGIAATHPRPLDRVFALLDPLLRRAAPVVKLHHAGSSSAQVRDDEAHAGEQLALVVLDHAEFDIGPKGVERSPRLRAARHSQERLALASGKLAHKGLKVRLRDRQRCSGGRHGRCFADTLTWKYGS